MSNILNTFLYAIFGKSVGAASKEEIERAKIAGEMAAGKAEERLGFVSKVKVDANEARKVAIAKITMKESTERTN